MASASIDHIVALIVFLSAITLFIGLFNQTIQTGITYQHNRAVASKCSDLLDNMLLSPGIPTDWGQTGVAPEGFGLQAVEFTQYKLSPFSVMRLRSATGTPVNYSMTGETYSNITMGFGQSLLVPYSEALDYSTVSRLLGINGSYGFSLTLAPIVNITISQSQPNPLTFSINVRGPGFPLANAQVDYCLITVDGRGGTSFPAYDISYGTGTTDAAGSASLTFSGFDGTSKSYALVVCAHLSGLVGMGYYEQVLYNESYVIPFISSTANKTAILAHSWDVTYQGDAQAAVHYNATFLVLSDDFRLREMPFVNATGSATGLLNSGQDPQHAYDTLTIGTSNPGILVITYSKSAQESGIVVMPWGLSSLAFTMTFGGDLSNKSWIATDLRQVTINGIAYQAKLSVWSLSGYQVNG
jgi:hypothetical protein